MNLHDMSLVQDVTGKLTGNGGAFSGILPYQYPWTIDNGSVSGNNFTFTAHYTDTVVCSFTLLGTIASNGVMTGTWTDNCFGSRNGTWSTTAGVATPICATIETGTITDSNGNPIKLGFDEYGYNYQAHIFNGTYDSSDRNLDGTYWGDIGDYVDDKLEMKWSDSWLSNLDCNRDHKLDRGLVNGIVLGSSRGWLTNHVVGDYMLDGNVVKFTDFVKIGWTGPGSPLWNEFKIIQEVYNDKKVGNHGLFIKLGVPGLGLNDQWTTSP